MADEMQMTAPQGTIRAVAAEDLPALKTVIDESGLFPSDMLDDMLSGHFAGTAENEVWLTFEMGGPVAIVYAAPERMTQGTWNLLLIAVHPRNQGHGIGAALMRHVETQLAQDGARVLLVETSGMEAFERTRAFYRNIGYTEEARIRDFYDAGDDKIVFLKALLPAAQ